MAGQQWTPHGSTCSVKTQTTHTVQWKNVQEHSFTVKCNCPSSCLCLFCNCSLCCFLPLVLQPSLQRRHHLLKPMNPILCSFIPSRWGGGGGLQGVLVHTVEEGHCSRAEGHVSCVEATPFGTTAYTPIYLHPVSPRLVQSSHHRHLACRSLCSLSSSSDIADANIEGHTVVFLQLLYS